jgi:hypothetical protein
MPAVQAIAKIEEIAAGYDGTGNAIAQRGPGLQIVIVQPGQPPHPEVAEKPAIELYPQEDATQPVKHE